MSAEVKREIVKLDKRIAKLQEQLDPLVEARQGFYDQLIEEAAQALNDLRIEAGLNIIEEAPEPQRRRNPGGKRALTDDQVREARTRCTQGASVYRLAKDYGLTNPAMAKMLRGETYQDVA